LAKNWGVGVQEKKKNVKRIKGLSKPRKKTGVPTRVNYGNGEGLGMWKRTQRKTKNQKGKKKNRSQVGRPSAAVRRNKP